MDDTNSQTQGNVQKDDRFQKLNSLVLNNEEFLIVADGENFDSLAAATGLALILKSFEKKVTLFSPSPIKAEGKEKLAGIEMFITEFPADSNRMIINFNCPVDTIEKISTSDENGKLAVLVDLKKDAVLNQSDISIVPGKANFTAGFIVGCELKNEQELVGNGDWVYISRMGVNKDWAKVNIVEKQATLSESVASFMSNSNFKIPPEAADNLYLGIKIGTENFEKADSIALETAAFCLRIKEDRQKSNKAGEISPVNIPEATPLEAVEKKDSSFGFQSPPIFTGATTPKV